jgi:NADH:ubiquinone oxidoreductase subunit E
MNEKLQVRICTGTTCFVMGASQLESLEEHLDPEIASHVEIQGTHCLDRCKERNYGKAPFVEIDGEIFGSMTLPQLVHHVTQAVHQSQAQKDRSNDER